MFLSLFIIINTLLLRVLPGKVGASLQIENMNSICLVLTE